MLFGRIANGVPRFLRSTAVLTQLPYQYRRSQCSVITVQALVLAVVHVALKQPATGVLDIMRLAWDEWSYPELLLLWGRSDTRISEACFIEKSRISGRLGMPRGESPWHAQNPFLGEWRKTLATTHYSVKRSDITGNRFK